MEERNRNGVEEVDGKYKKGNFGEKRRRKQERVEYNGEYEKKRR
jgi:hypothetical protein